MCKSVLARSDDRIGLPTVKLLKSTGTKLWRFTYEAELLPLAHARMIATKKDDFRRS